MKDLHLLVVDDDPTTLESLTQIVGGLPPASISKASNGIKAVEAYKEMLDQQKNEVVIIIDQYMPELDGIDAIKKMRELEEEAGNLFKAYIILVTGRPEIYLVTEALDAGADDFLSKPIHLGAFASTLLSAIQKQSARLQGA